MQLKWGEEEDNVSVWVRVRISFTLFTLSLSVCVDILYECAFGYLSSELVYVLSFVRLRCDTMLCILHIVWLCMKTLRTLICWWKIHNNSSGIDGGQTDSTDICENSLHIYFTNALENAWYLCYFFEKGFHGVCKPIIPTDPSKDKCMIAYAQKIH